MQQRRGADAYMTSASSEQHSTIPSLPHLPLLGNLLALRNRRLDLLLQLSAQFGDIGAFHFGPRLVPLLNAPELIRQALVEQSASFEKTATVRKLGTPVLGNSVFLSEGEVHRRQRKLLAPLFAQRHVRQYGEIMTMCALRLQESWQDGTTILLADEMTRLTLWIISKVLFDADILGEGRALGELLTFTFRHFADAVINPLRLPQSWPTPQNRRAQQAIKQVNSTIYRMIDERRNNGEARSDLLSTLLQAQDEGATLSKQQARNEILSLFVAGHETTATALTWCLYLLSQHPQVYEQLQAECDHVLAGRPPSVEDLPELPYTLQVFKETLRLYPPVYAFTRGTTEPVQCGKYFLPKGTSVVISPYTLHRRSILFPDPERFDPTRFDPQNEPQHARYSYIPFGAGPHMCPGMHFAFLEAHLLLATLTQRVRFEFAGKGPVKPEPLLTLRPEGKVPLRVYRR